MRFVVLGPAYNKQTHTKVSTRHNDQYQVGMRVTIALLTMLLWRLLEVRRRLRKSLNTAKLELTGPGLYESPMVLLPLTQVACFD